MVIIPDPGDDSSYYLFSIGVSLQFGLMYSKIDIRGDNGLGEVMQKNIQLLNFRMVDCITGIKHGNGRDWWVIVREYPYPPISYNNTWYVYLISTSGISSIPIQNVGSLNVTNSGRLCFNSDGTKMCFVNSCSMIELYDFNRCTGEVSNPSNIEPQSLTQPIPWYWSCEFSPSGQYLYVTSQMNPISRLWQFDTWAPNITASKTLIWQTNLPPYTVGALKRAPDNKIYLSCAWVDSSGAYNFPYDSTIYYPENMNLSVINSPDLPGLACNFQPWSFYLGGKRTYWGLPNNPDYDLGPLTGSACDTLVSISDIQDEIPGELFVYYASSWQTAYINAQKLKGNSYHLGVYDILGNEIFQEQEKLNSSWFTKNLNCSAYSKGMYIAVFQTEHERLVRKFLIE
jgi:hypothetical protein